MNHLASGAAEGSAPQEAQPSLPSSRLARQQQALLDALLVWPRPDAMQFIAAYAHQSGVRGLKVYESNGHMLAERALQAAYPAVAQLLGGDSFADLARALWHAHPPWRGDVACWGAELPDFLAASADLQDEPYLPDVARVEWALHRSATAPDPVPALESLVLLTTTDPDALRLRLAPASTVLASAWPVVSIVGAHRDQNPDFAQVGALLRRGVAQAAVVWRNGLKPCVRLALVGEAALLHALLAGQSLGGALDAAPALDFSSWLPQAVQSGLVLGVQPWPATGAGAPDDGRAV